NAAFVDDPDGVSDKRLDSPSIPIATKEALLTFRQSRDLEADDFGNYDGGVLEIKIGGGAFQDIVDAGGSFVTGGYDATIYDGSQSPIAGRRAWGGNSGGFVTTTVKLPAAAAGHSVVLRRHRRLRHLRLRLRHLRHRPHRRRPRAWCHAWS